MIFAPILMKNPDGSSIKTSRTNVNRKFSQIPHFFVSRRMADAQEAPEEKVRGGGWCRPRWEIAVPGIYEKENQALTTCST